MCLVVDHVSELSDYCMSFVVLAVLPQLLEAKDYVSHRCWSNLGSPKFIIKSLSEFDKFATKFNHLFQKQQTWYPYSAYHWFCGPPWLRDQTTAAHNNCCLPHKTATISTWPPPCSDCSRCTVWPPAQQQHPLRHCHDIPVQLLQDADIDWGVGVDCVCPTLSSSQE